LQMINHGVSTGALFLLVGVVYERRHTRLISDFGGLWKPLPVYASIFLVVMLSSIGLPGTNGFIGEFLVLLGAYRAHPVWAVIAASGVILSAVYMLWMFQRVMFGPVTHPENEKLLDLSLRERLVFAPLLLDFLPRRADSGRGAIVALATLLVSGFAVFRVRDARRLLFGGMFVHDGFTVFFTLLFCAIGVLSVMLSWDYIKRTRINQAEYYALLLSATLGMVLMAASNDLITIFLGLELMSLALYVLVGFRRGQLESNEAALKYFLLGAFASGFLLYGIALLY